MKALNQGQELAFPLRRPQEFDPPFFSSLGRKVFSYTDLKLTSPGCSPDAQWKSTQSWKQLPLLLKPSIPLATAAAAATNTCLSVTSSVRAELAHPPFGNSHGRLLAAGRMTFTRARAWNPRRGVPWPSGIPQPRPSCSFLCYLHPSPSRPLTFCLNFPSSPKPPLISRRSPPLLAAEPSACAPFTVFSKWSSGQEAGQWTTGVTVGPPSRPRSRTHRSLIFLKHVVGTGMPGSVPGTASALTNLLQ